MQAALPAIACTLPPATAAAAAAAAGELIAEGIGGPDKALTLLLMTLVLLVARAN
jgi:hypothetical protein